MIAPIQDSPGPNRRLAAATDGQGVILAIPYSSDARQRTSAEVLARRVSHRLGCPVALGMVQRGTLLADGSLRSLHAKGARTIVVAPAALSCAQPLDAGPRTMAQGAALNLTFRTAQPLGGDPLLAAAVLELLAGSERSPNPTTAIRLVLHPADAALAQALTRASRLFAQAGWGPAEVVVLDASGRLRPEDDQAPAAQAPRRIVVAVTILAGGFSSRVAAMAAARGDEAIQQTLHATDACNRLIATRVLEARRGGKHLR